MGGQFLEAELSFNHPFLLKPLFLPPLLIPPFFFFFDVFTTFTPLILRHRILLVFVAQPFLPSPSPPTPKKMHTTRTPFPLFPFYPSISRLLVTPFFFGHHMFHSPFHSPLITSFFLYIFASLLLQKVSLLGRLVFFFPISVTKLVCSGGMGLHTSFTTFRNFSQHSSICHVFVKL